MKRILYFLLLVLIIVGTVKWLKKNPPKRDSALGVVVAKFQKPVIKVKQINQIYGGKSLSFPLSFLQKKYKVIIAKHYEEDYDIIISDVFGKVDINSIDTKDALKMFYTSEAYLPNLDDYDLVFGFDRVDDDPRYIRLPYYYLEWKNDIKVYDTVRQNQGECNPKKEQFACFLVSNGSKLMGYNGKIIEGVGARDSMFNHLSEYKWVASGGPHLNNIGSPVPRGKNNTQEWLGQCKFVISYENQYHDGYITEKVFQAYFAGAVPIYWGDKTAVSEINKDAVIYADDFETEQDLIEYVKKVDNDDELYCKIWNNHLITNPEIDYTLIQEKIRKKLFELIDAKLEKARKSIK